MNNNNIEVKTLIDVFINQLYALDTTCCQTELSLVRHQLRNISENLQVVIEEDHVKHLQSLQQAGLI